ncbi:MAG TPA: RagB/SusD family nutrient uptake outer membrane protein [Mariniphaga sp.]|nr:RagB/SusD family nutrient uptake outer membrane protein [Mariniphaga sp.]
MKRINLIISMMALVIALSSCEDFLTYEPSDSVNDETAFNTAKDVENALNGVYYTLGRYQFYGRNVVALGDIAADNMYMVGTSGHFDQIYKYLINVDSPDLLDIWDMGYKTIDRSARLISSGKLLLEGDLTQNDEASIKQAISQAYGLKALSHFALVNIFGLPYSQENASTPGIVVVGDEPIVAFEEVSRSTVGETYNQILADIQSARANISDVPRNAFLFDEAALDALEARVKLYMKDWAGARTAALSAIEKSGGSLVKSADDYYGMWTSVSPTSEDIFTISKLANDNLSANALNTLYGSYDGKATSGLVSLFEENDMRLQLFEGEGETARGLKYMGLPSSAATSNIPVFRLPEMYLIVAEAQAQLGEEEDAIDYLWEVASRNPDLEKNDLPVEQADLLNFISVERRRELFQEGHRWFDLRRTGEIMSRVGGNFPITNWDASQFVYPLPSQEVNASGLAQNDGWDTALP